MRRDPSLIPLSHQHQHGLALCVMTGRSLDADDTDANVTRLARKVVDAWEVELANHFQVEEQVLFPACASPLVEELLAQHRQIETLVKDLRERPAASTLCEFTALLQRHIRLEENELFEQVQKDLPRDTLDLLGREIKEKTIKVCL